MTDRRAKGELEGSLLDFLWATGGEATPSVAHAAIAPELAYTTIMTVLSRMWKKGLVTRDKVGRSYAYSAVKREPDHRAGLMHSTLSGSPNPAAVLSSFVDTLTPKEVAVLRRLMDSPDS